MNNLTMRSVTITPDMATRMLHMNTKNRPLNLKRAYRLAEAIKRGEWQMNGDTIRISESGVVLDGQHRLKAIEVSGQSVETILVEGLPDCVFYTIDTNAKTRNAGDILAIAGEKNYAVLAAAASLLYKHEKTGDPYYSNALYYPTAQQIEEMVEKHQHLKDAVSDCCAKKFIKRYITSSQAAFALYVFRLTDKTKADSFFEKLESGAGLPSDSPILLLRDRLVLEANDKKTTMSKKYKMALMFKAFKLYLKEQTAKSLRVRMDGEQAEQDIFKI
jgi:hypothetical protein